MDITKIAIKAKSNKHGEEIIQWFKNKGVYINTLMGVMGYVYHVRDNRLLVGNFSDKKLLYDIPDEFTFGEQVLVSQDNKNWFVRIYLSSTPQTKYTFRTCHKSSENKFHKGENVDSVGWKFIKKISKQELAITVTLNGEPVPLSSISEETLLALRNKK